MDTKEVIPEHKTKSKPSDKSRSPKNARLVNHGSLDVSCSTVDDGIEEYIDTKMNEEKASDASNKPVRRSNSKVTFAPELETQQEPETLPVQPQGFRADYSLGERIRSGSHMSIEQSPDLAYDAVNALQKNDRAFIKRSDGTFSYAMVVDRHVKNNDEVLVFMVNSSKSTKSFPSKFWSDFIRCVAPTKDDTRSLYKDVERQHESSHNKHADVNNECDPYHVSPTCVRETLSSRAKLSSRFARTFEVLTSSITSGSAISGVSSSAHGSISVASSISDMVYDC